MRSALACAALSAVGLTTVLACGGGGEGEPTSTSTGPSGPGGSGGAGGSQSSSTTGGAPPLHPGALVDEGLVVRYYLDEAASGTAPTHAVDAAPDPLDLLITYLDDTTSEQHVQYAEDAEGHRGLRFDAASHDGRASILIDATKLSSMLQGGTSVTFELVADIDDVDSSGSRLIHFGFDSDHTLSFETSRVTRLTLSINDDGGNSALLDHSAYGRAVYHGVVDTTLADAAERAIFYVNGSRVQAVTAEGVDPNEALNLQTMRHFVIGNREIGDRSIAGMIYYAAVYNVAFSPAEVLQNAQLLIVDDDTP